MKNLTLLVVLCITSIELVHAQWYETNGPNDTYGRATCLAVSGSNILVGTNDPGAGIFITSNKGNTWNPIDNGISWDWITNLAVIGSTVYTVTEGGTYSSTDNGSNWTTLSDFPDFNQLAVQGLTIYAATSIGMYISTDNGADWTVSNTGLTDTNITSVVIKGSNVFVGTYSGVFVSNDNGAFWSSANNGITNAQILSLAVCGNNIIAGANGPNSRVFVSSNNGSSWTTTDLTETVQCFVTYGANVFAGTVGNSIYLSTDNGNTWNLKNYGLSSLFIYSLAISGEYIFAATEDDAGGSVWAAKLSDLVGITESHLSDSLSLFPNPTTDQVILQSSSLHSNETVTLSVKNVLGELLYEETRSWNTTMSIPTKRFPAGTYFLLIQSENGSAVKQFEKE